MRIEAPSTQIIVYNEPKPGPVTIEKQGKVTDSQLRSSVEIRNQKKQHSEYQPTMQEKIIIESIETANQKILGPEREFEFAIHKQTKQIMVKIIDKETQEVIREIPAEKVLDAVANMCELAGIFMDEKR